MTPAQRRKAEARRVARAERDRQAYEERQRGKAYRAAVGRQTAAELRALLDERDALRKREQELRVATFAAESKRLADEAMARRAADPAPVVPEVLPKRRPRGGAAMLGLLMMLAATPGGER